MYFFQIDNLCYQSFGPFTFYVEKCQTISLMGPSGAGKTLLLRSLADMDIHTGEILLKEQRCSDFNPVDWRKQVALLPAQVQWWNDRVDEHFSQCDKSHLHKLGLKDEVLNWQVSRLSQGEKQRLGLLRLLCHNPRVLLLDEPTANLDQTNTLRVESFLQEYQQHNDAAIIWVTHSEEQAYRVASRHFTIDNNKLVEEKS